MSDTLSAMREYRFLEDKRAGGGLSEPEEERWRELSTQLQQAPEAVADASDPVAYAQALIAQGYEPAQAFQYVGFTLEQIAAAGYDVSGLTAAPPVDPQAYVAQLLEQGYDAATAYAAAGLPLPTPEAPPSEEPVALDEAEFVDAELVSDASVEPAEAAADHDATGGWTAVSSAEDAVVPEGPPMAAEAWRSPAPVPAPLLEAASHVPQVDAAVFVATEVNQLASPTGDDSPFAPLAPLPLPEGVKPEGAAEPEPVLEAAPILEDVPSLLPELEAAPIVDVAAEPEPVLEAAPILEDVPSLLPELEVAPELDVAAEPEPVLEAAPILEDVPSLLPELEAAPELDVVAEPEPVLEAAPILEDVPSLLPELEAAPELDVVAEPEPVLEAAPILEDVPSLLPELEAAPVLDVVAEPEPSEAMAANAGLEAIPEIDLGSSDEPALEAYAPGEQPRPEAHEVDYGAVEALPVEDVAVLASEPAAPVLAELAQALPQGEYDLEAVAEVPAQAEAVGPAWPTRSELSEWTSPDKAEYAAWAEGQGGVASYPDVPAFPDAPSEAAAELPLDPRSLAPEPAAEWSPPPAPSARPASTPVRVTPPVQVAAQPEPASWPPPDRVPTEWDAEPANQGEEPVLEGQVLLDEPEEAPVAVDESAFAPGGFAMPKVIPPPIVAGENRVIVHLVEGQVKRGTVLDVDLGAPAIQLQTQFGSEDIPQAQIKAVFFMLPPGAPAPAVEGGKLRITFHDGRQLAGYSEVYDGKSAGFFIIPADARTNTERIYVYQAAVRQVATS